METCPFCAEEIQDEAIKCKHCGELLLDSKINWAKYAASYSAKDPQAQKEAWEQLTPYQRKVLKAMLSQEGPKSPQQRYWSPGVAAILSLIIPGAGQMYKGEVGQGFLWLFGVMLGYLCFIAPGVIPHIICIVKATEGDPYARPR